MRSIVLLIGFVFFALSARAELPTYGVHVVRSYPHDRHAYTEGLFYQGGFLYESTGQIGQSTIRKVRIEDGVVLQAQIIPPSLFGEGIVNWKDEIISLTWRDKIGFRWNMDNLTEIGEFHYSGEGWALTQDGVSLIMSDGTPFLRFLDPVTLREKKRVQVTAEGKPVENLNELEWVKGEIFANIWLTNRIARIDPSTGAVKGWIELKALPEIVFKAGIDDVPNGIAYDKDHDRLFITGKNWSHLYEITIDPPAGH